MRLLVDVPHNMETLVAPGGQSNVVVYVKVDTSGTIVTLSTVTVNNDAVSLNTTIMADWSI